MGCALQLTLASMLRQASIQSEPAGVQIGYLEHDLLLWLTWPCHPTSTWTAFLIEYCRSTWRRQWLETARRVTYTVLPE